MQKTKKIYTIILLLPFLDVFTSLLTSYYKMIITPGLIVKGLLMLISIIYVFTCKSKYKRFSSLFLMFLLIYSVLYFVSKPECFSFSFITGELIYLFKLFYFPVIFLALLCYFETEKFSQEKTLQLLTKTLFIYILLLLVPILLGSANDTYFYGLKGTIGWFYSGNEISSIILMLFASFIYFIETKKIIWLFSLLPIVYILFNIGTKVSYLGLIITASLLLCFGFFKNIKNNHKQIIKYLIVFVITLIFSFKSATIENNKYLFEHQISEEQISNPIDIDNDHKEEVDTIKEKIEDFYNQNSLSLILKKLFNNRDVYLANTISIYNNDNSSSKVLYGIGFSNTEEVNNKNIAKLIEIDIFDAFFHYGVIGLLIMLSPFLIAFYLIITSKSKVTLRSIYYIFVILMICGVSTFAGHTLTAPSVVIYIILYLLLILNEYKVLKQSN